MAVQVGRTRVDRLRKSSPSVRGTRFKVADLVAEQKAWGWSPEELHFQHPDLSLGQIHAALAYYWDHEAEMNKEIRERLKKTNALRKALARRQVSLAGKIKRRA